MRTKKEYFCRFGFRTCSDVQQGLSTKLRPSGRGMGRSFSIGGACVRSVLPSIESLDYCSSGELRRQDRATTANAELNFLLYPNKKTNWSNSENSCTHPMVYQSVSIVNNPITGPWLCQAVQGCLKSWGSQRKYLCVTGFIDVTYSCQKRNKSL